MEPRPINEILEDILVELRFANKTNREHEARLSALESKDQILRPKEACEFLDISYATLRSYRNKGYLKMVMRGGTQGYMMSELKRIKA